MHRYLLIYMCMRVCLWTRKCVCVCETDKVCVFVDQRKCACLYARKRCVYLCARKVCVCMWTKENVYAYRLHIHICLSTCLYKYINNIRRKIDSYMNVCNNLCMHFYAFFIIRVTFVCFTNHFLFICDLNQSHSK